MRFRLLTLSLIKFISTFIHTRVHVSNGKCGIIKQHRWVQSWHPNKTVCNTHFTWLKFRSTLLPQTVLLLFFFLVTSWFLFVRLFLLFPKCVNILILQCSSPYLLPDNKCPNSAVTLHFFPIEIVWNELSSQMSGVVYPRNSKFALITVTWKGIHIGYLNISLCIWILIFLNDIFKGNMFNSKRIRLIFTTHHPLCSSLKESQQ